MKTVKIGAMFVVKINITNFETFSHREYTNFYYYQ